MREETKLNEENISDRLTRRYERFSRSLQADDVASAAEEFARMCHLAQKDHLKLPGRAMFHFAEGWIDMFWMLRRHDMMLRVAEEAAAKLGPDPEWSFARGEALFYLGRFEEARAALEPLTVEEFEDSMLYYLLACLAERRGEEQAAAGLFATAHRLDPENYTLPLAIDEQRASEIYQQCLADLPDEIQWNLREVPIFISPLPSDELIHGFDPPIDPLVMGLFLGQPAGEPDSSWASDQPRILLFHKNIAKQAADLETLEDELRKTLFHEVGHYLGFDEDQLEEMGLG